jgi:hypothetical protein
MPRPSWVSLTDAIKVLVGRGDLQPALPEDGDAKREASTRGFNAAVLARATQSAEFGYLASPVTGGGVRVDRIAQIYLRGRREGADPATLLAKLLEGAASPDGKVLSPDEARAAVQKESARIGNDILPLLKRLGID